MEPNINNPEYEDIHKRMQAGIEKKLWRIEVLYRLGAETRKHGIENQYGHEVTQFREMIFRIGLRLPVDPGHWVIVPPWEIITIDLWRQDRYFKPVDF